MMETNFSYTKENVYDVSWQILRVSLLAENNTYGGFGTTEGAHNNWYKLVRYFDDKDISMIERARRLHRVNNLLAATLLGLKGKKEKISIYNYIEARQNEVSNAIGTVLMSAAWKEAQRIGHNWDLVTVHLEITSDNDLILIWSNLQKRVKTADRKEAIGIGGMKYRNELQRFLDLLIREMSKRGLL